MKNRKRLRSDYGKLGKAYRSNHPETLEQTQEKGNKVDKTENYEKAKIKVTYESLLCINKIFFKLTFKSI